MKIIGHRGARGLAPENTLVSLRKAIQHHVDMIEFDVRVTSDGVPILHHDPDVTEPSGNRYSIADNSFLQLKQYQEDLATLDEAVQVAGRTALYIEVKPHVPTKPIIKTLGNNPPAQFTLASKSQKTLRELHKAFPESPTIVIEPWSGLRARWRARQVDTKVVAMNQRFLWWGFIRGFKNSDWQLYAYTLNDPRKAVRWARWGLSGVVTDYPDRFEK